MDILDTGYCLQPTVSPARERSIMNPPTIVNMVRMTVSVNESDAAMIEALAGDDGPYESKSAVMRECIHRYDEVEELQQTIERLENEKRLILEHREEHTDLVEAVQRDKTITEQKAHAGVLTRLRWWATGMPDK